MLPADLDQVAQQYHFLRVLDGDVDDVLQHHMIEQNHSGVARIVHAASFQTEDPAVRQRLAAFSLLPGEIYALKTAYTPNVDPATSLNTRAKIEKELAVAGHLVSLHNSGVAICPHIARIYGWFLSEKDAEGQQLETPSVSLVCDRVSSLTDPENERAALTVLPDVVEAVRFLHRHGIAHGSITKDRIGVAERVVGGTRTKVCVLRGFGNSSVFANLAAPGNQTLFDEAKRADWEAVRVLGLRESSDMWYRP
jgi:hypothetical protein